jgi:hypothetical protein
MRALHDLQKIVFARKKKAPVEAVSAPPKTAITQGAKHTGAPHGKRVPAAA